MRGHTDELYVLESHPKDPHILISAGHDGKMIIWDVKDGISLASFANLIDGQGHGGLFDAKWSPDGTMVAATDSHGHMLMYGFGDGHKRLKELPPELFFTRTIDLSFVIAIIMCWMNKRKRHLI